MPDWLRIYHKLPYPAQMLAAGARGRYLNRWRYSACLLYTSPSPRD